jgi:protein TonB
MFESTLAAQGLNDSDRRLGTLSAVVLAHAGIVAAILAVTALIVPNAHVPEPQEIRFITVLPPPAQVLPEPPASTPAPQKGTQVAKPGRPIAPAHAAPEAPPTQTPDSLPVNAPDKAPDGPDTPGDGALGIPSGSDHGVGDGTGNGGGSESGPGGGPQEMTGDMVRPLLLVKVEPAYPRAARAAGLGGRVTLRAVIAEDGGVESVEVVGSTNPLFNDAAVDAVRRWRYSPALMSGRPVRVFFTVRVDFLVR